MKNTTQFAAWIAVAAIAVSGAAFAASGTKPGTLAGGADASVDQQQIKIKNDVLSDPQSVKTAETVFYQNCVYCHGAEGSGGKARRLQCREFKPDYLFHTISKGKKRGSLVMPPWEKTFDEKERWQLVAYILSLKDLPACKK